jgi:adenine-specific DNA-methyltransferase
MFDQADLDFGIYRIMNAKRDEIKRFLDKDLLPQVRQSLAELESGDRAQIESDLAKAIEQANELGVDPETTAKVKQLREQLTGTADIGAIESEVFSHLYEFFRRYYNEGDFLSLRRYKAGVYAIPYEGEEEKLHWANADQYYIKTTENFRDYIFTLTDGRRVHFKVVEADTEPNNNTAANGKDRRFILAEEPIAEENDELVVRFEFRSDDGKRKQAELNKEALERVLASDKVLNWIAALATKSPTEKNPERTLLEKRLNEYTARNTFDYFIHKDLAGFLYREFDFYIKNEVMFLDDVESDIAPHVEQYLAKIKAMRRIAHKIIDFLAQLENFQKRLWLKKKFVLETNYCVTLDRVPEELYREIAANEAQREEWVRLFAIDEINQDLSQPVYTAPLSIEFLKANRYLTVDTKFFNESFTLGLVKSFDRLDDELNGVCISSENFQALQLIQARYRKQIRCTYIDPPYNAESSEILYKNNYKSSSWVALIDQSVKLSKETMSANGVLCATIDDEQQKELAFILRQIFTNALGTVCIRINPSGRVTLRGFAQSHEYAIFVGRSSESSIGKMPRSEEQLRRFNRSDERGVFEWRNFRREGSSSERYSRPRRYFPLYVKDTSFRIPKMEWNEDTKSYNILESHNADEEEVYPIDSEGSERVWRWGVKRVAREADQIVPRQTNGDELQIYYKYRPNKAGVLPLTIWIDKKYSATEYGTALLKKIFGRRNVFDFPKSIFAVEDCVRIASSGDNTAIVLDYFAGSGTTAHAVINLNREDDGTRKYVLVDVEKHFDSVLIPRIKKVAYCKDWRDGKPVSREGSSHFFKYIRLESYEDVLNNLDMKRSADQSNLLEKHDEFRESYTLRYMLDTETRDSASLLNVKQFSDPFSYKLRIAKGGIGNSQISTVDLIETFNYLLGLHVKHIDTISGFRIVEGANPDNERVLIIWRNTIEKSNDELDKFFQKQAYKTKDAEFDLIYVNGDNNLDNLRRADETWKVRLIEQEFQRLMFDVRDI